MPGGTDPMNCGPTGTEPCNQGGGGMGGNDPMNCPCMMAPPAWSASTACADPELEHQTQFVFLHRIFAEVGPAPSPPPPSPSPMPPPPPPSSPPPPGSPGASVVHNVVLGMQVSGSVATFDSAAFRTSMASSLSVSDPSMVLVEYCPSPIRVAPYCTRWLEMPGQNEVASPPPMGGYGPDPMNCGATGTEPCNPPGGGGADPMNCACNPPGGGGMGADPMTCA